MPPRLKVSENRRFLVFENGRPFFYLADKAWELFHRLSREDADLYLETRARQGFTVIQAVALAELDGLNVPNAYGHRPLLENDPTRPDVREGPRNDYWDHVDYIVDKALLPWQEAMEQPGAGQMQFGRRLVESRPYLSRIPDDSVVVESAVPTAVPGAGRYRLAATRDATGTFAMVYAPVGRKFRVRMNCIVGPRVVAWWYNPRDGSCVRIGEFPNTGEREFQPPSPGEYLDWVSLLDDASKGFVPPGAPAGR